MRILRKKRLISIAIIMLAVLIVLGIRHQASNNQINESFEKFGVSEARAVYVDGKKIGDTYPTVLTLVPLRATMKALGYDVIWDGENFIIEAFKASQYTKITISQNQYFINGIGSVSLSNAPYVKNGRTQVPVEFFYEVFGVKIEPKEDGVNFSSKGSFKMDKITGTVTEIKKAPLVVWYTVSKDSDPLSSVIVEASEDTIFQKKIKIDSKVTVLGVLLNNKTIKATAIY